MTRLTLIAGGVLVSISASILIYYRYVSTVLTAESELRNKAVWVALQQKSVSLEKKGFSSAPVVVDIEIDGKMHRVLAAESTRMEHEVTLILLDLDMGKNGIFYFPEGAAFNATCSQVDDATRGEIVIPSVSRFLLERCITVD